MTRILFAVVFLISAAASGKGYAQELPPDLQALFASGVEKQKAGDLASAEKAFLEVLRRGGKHAYVYNNLGLVYQRRGEHEQALAQFREAMRLDAGYVAPRVLAGVSLVELGKLEEAAAEFKRAIRMDPGNEPARIELAGVSVRTGNLADAIEQYRWLRHAHPQDPEYAYLLGTAYRDYGLTLFRNAQRRNPRSARVEQLLGEQYFAQGQLDAAAAAFEAALKADPSLPGVHLALAQIALRQNNVERARHEVDRELAIVPESALAAALKRKLEAPISAGH